MYLVISALCLVIGAAGAAFGWRQKQRAAVLRRQLEAFHAAGMEKDRKNSALREKIETLEREMEQTAQAARKKVLTDVQNLLNYDGTDRGQMEHDYDEE